MRKLSFVVVFLFVQLKVLEAVLWKSAGVCFWLMFRRMKRKLGLSLPSVFMRF